MTDLVALVALILAVYAAVLSTGLVLWVIRSGNRESDVPSSPAAYAVSPQSYSGVVPTDAQKTRQPAIMLIDEELDSLIILQRLVHDLAPDYEIIAAVGGTDVLAHVMLRPVPLVITGYRISGMDGLQLTKAIKETQPQTYVIMITAYATPELEQRALDHRIDYFLPKPFPSARLAQILADIGISTR